MLLQWIKANNVLLMNAGSLFGTTIVTSGLGFVYWLVAARHFTPEAIGIASASISTMTLLGTFCIVGLGTLLITELPRQPQQASSLISTALVVVAVVSGCVGLVFALIAPYMSNDFVTLRGSIANVTLFVIGVMLTAVTLVLDQAFIGILRGGLQLSRNTLFAVIKLVALSLVSFLLSNSTGITIYATWTVGNALSLAIVTVPVLVKGRKPIRSYLPQWHLLRTLGSAAIQHHLLNMIVQFPGYALPVLVTIVLSAKMNALFYISWMLVNFIFYVPVALTTVLHAMNSAQKSTLAHRIRATIGLALLTSIVAGCLLQLATKQVLGVFGSSYEQATWTLRILVFAAFPLIIKNHYISLCRIHDQIKSAMLVITPGCLFEIGAAMLGAHLNGLLGLSIGWVGAVSIETLFMVPALYRVLRVVKTSPEQEEQNYLGTEAVWLIETMAMPAIGHSGMGLEAVWLAATSPTGAMRHPVTRKADQGKYIHTTNQQNNETFIYDSRRTRNLKPPRLQHYTACNDDVYQAHVQVESRLQSKKHESSTLVK